MRERTSTPACVTQHYLSLALYEHIEAFVRNRQRQVSDSLNNFRASL